jgi:hypothetical protein
LPETTPAPSCGHLECSLEALTSARVDVDDDVVAFSQFALDAGWGDGLPLVPPTEERVLGHVTASGRHANDVLCDVPPRGAACTVEKLAINAVMAGAPAAAMPLLCAAFEAMGDRHFNLFALNTTTSCVVPGLFVNGPARHDVGIPYAAGCFGGEAGPGPAIGRATRLVMRNVGGQVAGLSSKSVFGQPGRVSGIVVGEWEERSPWAPLAERRGVVGNAVTVHGATGTVDVADITADNGRDLLQVIGASLAFPGTNAFIGRHHGAQILVAIGPPWADLIARDVTDLAEVHRLLWDAAALPATSWPARHRDALEANGRVDDAGLVHLVAEPADLLLFVCGGLGNLHALACHSFGPTRAVTAGF